MSQWIDGEFKPASDCFVFDAIGAIVASVGLDAGIGGAAAAGLDVAGAAAAGAEGVADIGALGAGLGGAAAAGLDVAGGAAGGAADLGAAGVGADVAGDAASVAGTALDSGPATAIPGLGGAPTTTGLGSTLGSATTPASIAGTPATGVGGAGLSAAATGTAPGDLAAPSTIGTSLNSASPLGSVSSDLSPDLSLGTAPNSTAGLGGLTTPPQTTVLGPNSFDNLINNPSLGTATQFAKNNPSLLLGGAGLAFQELNKPKLPGEAQLGGSAAQLGKQATQLTQAELTGNLPPGAQAGVTQAVQANQARIRSQFAQMGLSGSSMETEALNQASLQGQSLGFQIAQQMAQQGLSEAQLSNAVYSQLLQVQLEQDQQTATAISNFAAAAGGGNTVNLRVTQ